MSFSSMIQELLGAIPGSKLGLVKTKINEAFQAIQNESVWSFQCITGGWLTPGLLGSPNALGYGQGGYGQGPYGGGGFGNDGLVPRPFLSPGTISIVPYTNTLLGDAVATAAWTAQLLSPPLITQYQFRVPYYRLYSATALQFAGTVAYLTMTSGGNAQTPGTYLVSGVGGSGQGSLVSITVDQTGYVTQAPIVLSPGSGYSVGGVANPPTFTLVAGGTPATFTVTLNAIIVLDRPWMEPLQVNSGYMAYQAYFYMPVGFKRFYALRDTTNNNSMNWGKKKNKLLEKNQIDLANDDAERTIFDQPYYAVPFQVDTRPGSATLGQWAYELWPHPITILPYTWHVQANWPPLVNPSDTLPYPLTEEVVKMRAYEMLALWKEGNKGDEMERGSGANWQFLAKAYREEYNDRLKEIRIMDRHFVDLYFTKARTDAPYGGEPYSTVTGNLNVGWF